MSPSENLIEGKYCMLEMPLVSDAEIPSLLNPVITSVFETWGEDCWIVRRLRPRQLPPKKFLDSPGVLHKSWSRVKYQFFFPIKENAMNILYPTQESFIEDIKTDYSDEIWLLLDMIPHSEFESASEAIELPIWLWERQEEVYSVWDRRAAAGIWYIPYVGVLRVFSRDDSAVRYSRLLKAIIDQEYSEQP